MTSAPTVDSISAFSALQSEVSAKLCPELGWDGPYDALCARTKVLTKDNEDVCPPSSYFVEAWTICKGAYARLCTIEELVSGLAAAPDPTGCELDSELVWSSTMCADGVNHQLAPGGGGYGARGQTGLCGDGATSRGVRCCADTDISVAERKKYENRDVTVVPPLHMKPPTPFRPPAPAPEPRPPAPAFTPQGIDARAQKAFTKWMAQIAGRTL